MYDIYSSKVSGCCIRPGGGLRDLVISVHESAKLSELSFWLIILSQLLRLSLVDFWVYASTPEGAAVPVLTATIGQLSVSPR